MQQAAGILFVTKAMLEFSWLFGTPADPSEARNIRKNTRSSPGTHINNSRRNQARVGAAAPSAHIGGPRGCGTEVASCQPHSGGKVKTSKPANDDIEFVGHLDSVEAAVEGLANGIDDETDLAELLNVKDVTAIKDEAGLDHRGKDAVEVKLLVLVPLGGDDEGVGAVAGLLRAIGEGDVLLKLNLVELAGIREVGPDLLGGALRVGDHDLRLLLDETADNVNGGSLTSVTSVLLESKTEKGNLLGCDGVEETVDDAGDEALLLEVVHLDNLLEVVGNVGEAHALAKVAQVENILLEAGATISNGSLEELGADTGVHADGAGNLIDIGAGGLADGGNGVDGGNTLGKERVGDELGELGRPDVGLEDALLGDPVVVDIGEDLAGLAAGLVHGSTDEDTVRLVEVVHGSSLSEELRVGQDIEAGLSCAVEDGGDSLGRLDGNSRLLDNNLGGLGDGCNLTGSELPVGEVGGTAGANSNLLRRGVDGDEDDVSLLDSLVNLGGEEQVLATAGLDDLVKTRLVDRKVVGVPGVNTRLRKVNNGDGNLWALHGNHGHGLYSNTQEPRKRGNG